MKAIYRDVVSWLVQIKSKVATLHILNTGRPEMLKKAFDARIKLIMKGLIISTRIKNILSDSILLRFKLGYEIDKGMRPGILLLINLAKKIEEAINGRDVQLMQDLMIKYMGLNISKKI